MGACHQQFYDPNQLGCPPLAAGLCLRSDLDVRVHRSSSKLKKQCSSQGRGGACRIDSDDFWVPRRLAPAANLEETKLDAEEDYGTKSLGTGIRSTGENQSQNDRKPCTEGAEGHRVAPGTSAQKQSRVRFLL